MRVPSSGRAAGQHVAHPSNRHSTYGWPPSSTRGAAAACTLPAANPSGGKPEGPRLLVVLLPELVPYAAQLGRHAGDTVAANMLETSTQEETRLLPR